jgi:hypothetical protein
MKLYELKNLTNAQIEKLERIMSKRLGAKIYRWGGKQGAMHAAGFDGYLYTFGNGKAFRLNYSISQKEIVTIDYWNDISQFISTGEGIPTYQLQFPKGLTLISTIGSVVRWLRKPIEKNIDAELETIKEGQLDEARASYEDFVAAAAKYAQQTGKTDMRFTEEGIQKIKYAADISIPGKVWTRRVPGVKPVMYDLSDNELNDDPTAVSASTGYQITVVAGSESRQHSYNVAAGLTKQDEKKLNTVVNVQELFDDLQSLIRMVIQGSRVALVVVGGAGIGKTQTIMDTIDTKGLEKGKDFIVVKGKISPLSLFTTLFLNSDKLIIFDDTDSVWDNADAINILKAALDSKKVRTVDWVSPVTQNVTRMTDDERDDYVQTIFDNLDKDPETKFKPPSQFDFTGKIIFISNRSRGDLDAAVINRALTIDMTLTTEQVFERIEGIMEKLEATNGFVTRIEDKKMVLDFLQDESKAGRMGYVSIRTFVGALGIVSSGDPNWKRLLKYSGGE